MLLSDQRLPFIIGAKECVISHRCRVSKAPLGIPWAVKTKLGWIVYDEDESLKSNEAKNFNLVKIFNQDLDRKLDFCLKTSFDESRHDESKALDMKMRK